MANLKSNYDVVVVGGGMGGLTCGALLAKEGLDILVIERLPRPGGYCSSLRDEGFSFDPAVGILEGCDKGGVVYQTLTELNVEGELELIKLDPANRVVGTDFDISVAAREEGFEDDLKRLSPGEGENIHLFLEECKALYREMAVVSKGSLDLMGLGQKLGFMKDFLLKCPRLRKYSGKSAKEVTRSFFTDPKLRAIMHGTAIFLDPGTQASILMNIIGMAANEDIYYPREGGIQALPDIMVKALERNGSQIALNTTVSRILVEKSRAIGVELDGGNQIKAKYVVSNIDGKNTFLKLIGEEHLSPKFIKELNTSKIYGSVVSISLGVDMDFRAMGIQLSDLSYCPTNNVDELFSGQPEKSGLMVRLHSLLDSAQAPPGKSTMGIVACFPYNFNNYWKLANDGQKGKEYEALKGSVAGKLIASMEKVVPGLSEHIVYKRIATPITFEQATLNSEGSAMGWYPLPGGKMRSQKTPIKNLYQAGHWTFPGGSVPAVVASGRNAAQLILKETQ
jgi:all-trans-retinol 13,14-reductase